MAPISLIFVGYGWEEGQYIAVITYFRNVYGSESVGLLLNCTICFTFLGNWPPTPTLIQHFARSEK